MAPEPHPALGELLQLVGTWVGTGTGIYSTIDTFEYSETVVFGHVGKPFVSMVQRTAGSDGAPLHGEFGFLRPAPDGLEVCITYPTGHAEMAAGAVAPQAAGLLIEWETTSMVGSPSALDIAAVRRSLHLHGDRLSYSLDMAAVGQPMQRHLTAELVRQ